ncbi:MAG TPA: 3-oxoacyl-ACP reductase FabG [Nevskiaceae bacterium]
MVESRRWVLVTGSSRGIGRACALALAADGFGVVVHGRSDSASLRAVRTLIADRGGAARTLAFDVADRAACATALAGDIAEHDAYFGVVCNAGITADSVFPAMTGAAWDAVLRADLDSFYNVVRPLIMPMIRARRGGRIVAMTSAAGQIGNRGQVNYSAAKAGLIGAVKALAVELASRRITVNAVAPGLIATDMTAALPDAELHRWIPAGRSGTPEEVAALVAFLCSTQAVYITRQVIGVNGGLC